MNRNSIICIIFACVHVHANSQFHLSLVGDESGDYIMDWKTPHPTNRSSMALYPNRDATQKTILHGSNEGVVEEEHGVLVDCWTTRLTQLTSGEQYSYHLTTAPSQVHHFTVQDTSNMTWAVFGDFGSVSQGGASGVSFPALREADANEQFQGILHVGDISYELTGKNGMDFMNELESMSDHMPLHTTVGNHEYRMAYAPYFTLRNYHRRFAGIGRGAGASSKSHSSAFYSFNAGHVHFIVLNAEVYGNDVFYVEQPNGEWVGSEDARLALALHQADWMERDLQQVDRQRTPFVVVCAHRPPFKTPHGMERVDNRFKVQILPLLSNYNVDLFLCGHIHAYTRFEATTVYGYRMPPIILSGGAGSNEFLQSVEDIEFGKFSPKIYISQYGYGYLTATSDTLEWQWGRTATDAMEEPTPTFWSIQDSCTIRKQSFRPLLRSVTVGKEEKRFIRETSMGFSTFWYGVMILACVAGLLAWRRKFWLTRYGYSTIH